VRLLGTSIAIFSRDNNHLNTSEPMMKIERASMQSLKPPRISMAALCFVTAPSFEKALGQANQTT